MTTAPLPPSVRTADRSDVPAIVAMVRELADYERAVDRATMTPEQLTTALFSPDPAAHALVGEVDGHGVAGFALWYRTFSTWDGVPGIHLEDLFVRPEARGTGLGRRLLTGLARTALERGYSRVEWDVLRWNAPAIGFYDSLDAQPQDEWLGYRLSGPAIAALAQRD
jgi:GNAT superfamily N-acetyltransferase